MYCDRSAARMLPLLLCSDGWCMWSTAELVVGWRKSSDKRVSGGSVVRPRACGWSVPWISVSTAWLPCSSTRDYEPRRWVQRVHVLDVCSCVCWCALCSNGPLAPSSLLPRPVCQTMLVVERAALHWKRVTLAHRLLLARSTAAVSNQSGSAGSTAVPAFTARDHILYHLSAAGHSAHHPSANSSARTSSYHTAVPSAPLTGYQHALPPAAAVPLRDDQDDNIRLRADVSTRYAIPVTAPPASQPGRMMASVSSLNMPAASFNSYSYRSAPTDVLELLAEIDQLCSQRQQRLSAAGHPAAASSLSKPN